MITRPSFMHMKKSVRSSNRMEKREKSSNKSSMNRNIRKPVDKLWIKEASYPQVIHMRFGSIPSYPPTYPHYPQPLILLLKKYIIML